MSRTSGCGRAASGARDRARGDERRARDEPAALVDPDLAEPLALAHRQRDIARRDDPLDERDAHPLQPDDGPRAATSCTAGRPYGARAVA